MSPEGQQLIESGQLFALAAALSSYPDAELGDAFAEAGDVLRQDELASVVEAIRHRGIESLRQDYTELFDRGTGRTSVYETEYGRMRGMSKGKDLADVAGFYKAFGAEVDADAHEMLDHVAVELEFYARLLQKEACLMDAGDEEGVDIVRDARGKFLKEHLGGFVPAIAARPAVSEHAVYGPVFRWVAALLERECAVLVVTPAPLDFFADPEANSEVKCATSLPIIQ